MIHIKRTQNAKRSFHFKNFHLILAPDNKYFRVKKASNKVTKYFISSNFSHTIPIALSLNISPRQYFSTKVPCFVTEKDKNLLQKIYNSLKKVNQGLTIKTPNKETVFLK